MIPDYKFSVYTGTKNQTKYIFVVIIGYIIVKLHACSDEY